MLRKNEKNKNIELVEEVKFLGVIVQAKRNVVEGQENETTKKRIEHDNKLYHRKK